MSDEYLKFLESKLYNQRQIGKEISISDINPILFDFQRDIVKWAVNIGRAAIFLDTGLGKTFIQLEWARLLDVKTIIIAPLSVARQTVREAKKLSIPLDYVRSQDQVNGRKIVITNYEVIDHFDFSKFDAIVLDESSILKSLAGKTKNKLIEKCKVIKYRLACTATPAPNDYTELGNHVEFLGIAKATEMLAMFFVNANKEKLVIQNGVEFRIKGSNKNGTEWRLKHHAEKPFFTWLSGWAFALTKPSDLGYSDDGFILPPLNIQKHVVDADFVPKDQLFFTHIKGVKNAAEIRRQTAEARLVVLKDLLDNSKEQWIIWAGLNKESSLITKNIQNVVEVRGSDSPERKAQVFEDFQDGKIQILVTKPSIAGFGMNFQNAHNMAFFGLNYSWEQYYQCIRREWRYMQESQVNVHIILSKIEESIYANIMRKDKLAKKLRKKLIEEIQQHEVNVVTNKKQRDTIVDHIEGKEVKSEEFLAILGDSCEELKRLPENSIDLSVYSPPFADLYTYSDSLHDLGNSRNWDEFFEHYRYIIQGVFRVTKPGRLSCVHVSDIPAMASRDGYIGVKDFPGHVIKAHEEEGWVFVGRAFVQKNPQAQAIRTKSKALLFTQMRKDSSDSRPALVDQVLIFKKPGENKVPITPVANGELDNETWIEWAHGIWLGISESDTLQYMRARGEEDEKHICPLQLGTIERCIKLYSNPGETVLTPFGGIGSEGYTAVKFGRKAVLIELKPEYFDVLVKNMKKIEIESKQVDLFSLSGIK